MLLEYAKKNRWLSVLAVGIFSQLLLLITVALWNYVAIKSFASVKGGVTELKDSHFSFWDYIWRSGEVMATYGNVARIQDYQDSQVPNLIKILFTGSSTSNNSSTADTSSLVSSFRYFNLAIQLAVVSLCVIGFIGVFNVLIVGFLVWQYLLSAQVWNFKKLLLVSLLNVLGLWIAHYMEENHLIDLTPSPRLLKIEFINNIKKLQNNKQVINLHGRPGSNLIEVKNLSFAHGDKSFLRGKRSNTSYTLKDINLTVRKGSFTVIIGPNGSGKTTLLKALINLHKNFSGEVLWAGKRISEINRTAFSRQVSYIPQLLNLQNAIPVLDFLEFARYPYRQLKDASPESDRELAMRAVQKNDCEKLKDRIVNELSGGQKQKIILTSVLVQESEVIVLDEPTSYLDIKNQHQFLEILSGFHKQGKTIIMILHDLRQSIKYADHLVVVKDGRIRASGHPKDVVSKELFRDVFKIDCDISFIPGGVSLNNIYAI